LEQLKRSNDFKRVRQLGKSYSHPIVVLIALQSENREVTRIGVTAGRAVGGAVQRNRAKRLIKAALTSLVSHADITINSGWDIVLLARRPILQQKSQAVQLALGQLFQRANLFVG